MKAKKHFDLWNMLFSVFVCFFVLFGWMYVKENRISVLTDMPQKMIRPTQITELADGAFIYQFQMKEPPEVAPSLMFYTNHQEVQVYADDRLIYYNKKIDSIYGHTTGSVWHLVKIPQVCQVVWIKTTPVYPEVPGSVPEFFYGDGKTMFEKMIVSSFPSLIICVLICCLGLCLLIFYFLVCRRSQQQHDVLDLGMFAILLGVWSFGETEGAIILLRPRILASYTGFTCLMFLGIPFVLFIRNFLRTNEKWFSRSIIIYCTVVAILCQGMQFFGIRDIKQNVMWIHLEIVWLIIYSIYASVYCFVKKQNIRRVCINAMGLSAMVGSALLDLSSYYSDRVNANHSGKIGFLIYITILGIDTARTTQKQMEKQRKLTFYQELALMDMQTQCYNRNAFNEDSEQLTFEKPCHIVTFDLNNLKKCNDCLGHNNGDAYIEEAAKLICQIFSDYGRVYRIGGDEFCVISRKLSLIKIQVLLEKLHQVEKTCNFYHMGEVPLRIACGYAEFDAKQDRTFEDTRNRADEVMYKNKKELKAEQ